MYIGRTLKRLQNKRDKAHIFDTEKDAVAKFAKEHDIAVPKMKVIEKDLTIEQGAEREGYWEKYYREHGWTTLNRTKTGSIGKLGRGVSKYDKETLFRIASNCITRTEFKNKSRHGYTVALQKGWIDEWFGNKRNSPQHWDFQSC